MICACVEAARDDEFSWVSMFPEVRAGLWHPRLWVPEASWRHHKKCFRVGRLECLDQRHREVWLRLVLEDDGVRGSVIYQALNLMWAAGLRPPARYRVPRAFACDYTGRVVRAFVPGQTWADRVLLPEAHAPGVSADVASWLMFLQHAVVLNDSVQPMSVNPGRPVHYAADIAKMLGGRTGATRKIENVALVLAQSLDVPSGTPQVLSHGDLHPKNVLLSGPAVVAIDVEKFGWREPAADVGRALGQLLSMSVARVGSMDPGANAGQVFWRSYEAAGGLATWDRVAIHLAVTLLECVHYTTCVRHGHWPGSPRQWAAHLERCLNSDGPEVLSDADGLRPLRVGP